MILIGLWALFPIVRPDKGIFPIWPYGVFLLAGYFYVLFGQSRYNTLYLTGVFFIISCIHIYFWAHVQALPCIVTINGILFVLSLLFISIITGLVLEHNKLINKMPFTLIIRFGRYPLTLYFFQQFVTRFCIKFQLTLPISLSSTINWLTQASIIIMLMLAGTYLLDLFKFFRIEWLLRKIETAVLNLVPERYSPRPDTFNIR